MTTAIPADTVDAAAGGWLDAIAWDERGLVTVVAQEAATGDVLMVAWMNREALERTLATGQATYWSRSRRRLWRKGEESGHTQAVREIRADCDGDTLLLKVDQKDGVACHTGRHACFFQRLERDADGRPGWRIVEPVLVPPGAPRGAGGHGGEGGPGGESDARGAGRAPGEEGAAGERGAAGGAGASARGSR